MNEGFFSHFLPFLLPCFFRFYSIYTTLHQDCYCKSTSIQDVNEIHFFLFNSVDNNEDDGDKIIIMNCMKDEGCEENIYIFLPLHFLGNGWRVLRGMTWNTGSRILMFYQVSSSSSSSSFFLWYGFWLVPCKH